MARNDKTSFTFFFPGSRLLSSAEISALSEDQRKAAEDNGREGVWLEVPSCPDGACMKKDGKVVLQALGAVHKKERGIWLNVFCPEDSCLWKGGTELP